MKNIAEHPHGGYQWTKKKKVYFFPSKNRLSPCLTFPSAVSPCAFQEEGLKRECVCDVASTKSSTEQHWEARFRPGLSPIPV